MTFTRVPKRPTAASRGGRTTSSSRRKCGRSPSRRACRDSSRETRPSGETRRERTISSRMPSKVFSRSRRRAWSASKGENGSSAPATGPQRGPGAKSLRPSWRVARGGPGKRDRVPDVLELADPLDEPFHPHAEARMLHGAEATGVEVPVVGCWILALVPEGLLDCLEIRFPFAPADDLPDAVPRNHVEAQDDVGLLRIPRLVEGLGDPGIVRHDHGLRLPLREDPFLQGPEVLSPFDLHPLGHEELESLVVREPFEGRRDGLEELRRAAEGDDLVRTLLRDAPADMGDDSFRVPEDVVHPRPGLLHLRVPELRQVAGRSGLLGPERGTDVVHLLHREDESLRIELPGLGQVRLPSEVFDLEEGRAALATRGGKHGRVDLPEAPVPEVLVHGVEDRVPDAEDRRHALGADPEMPDIEEELLAEVLLDRELLREVDDPDVGGADLNAARGSLVLDDGPADERGGFDEGLLDRGEGFRWHRPPRDGRLDDSCVVAQDDEDLAAHGPRPVDPAAQLDLVPRMGSSQDVGDGDHDFPAIPVGLDDLFEEDERHNYRECAPTVPCCAPRRTRTFRVSSASRTSASGTDGSGTSTSSGSCGPSGP